MGEKLLSTGDAGKLIGVDGKTVARMCADGGYFPGARPTRKGGHWRIPRADVEAHIESLRPKKRQRAS